jgi:hypothetical protein
MRCAWCINRPAATIISYIDPHTKERVGITACEEHGPTIWQDMPEDLKPNAIIMKMGNIMDLIAMITNKKRDEGAKVQERGKQA